MSQGHWYLLPILLGPWLLIMPSGVESEQELLQGTTFTMACFDAPVKFYVELIVTTLRTKESTTVAKFSGPDDRLTIIDAVTYYEERLSMTSDGNAVLSNIAVYDEGTYKCITRSGATSDVEKEEVLKVLVRPEITVELQNSPLKAGGSSTNAAKCKATGARPAADVSWSSESHLAYNNDTTIEASTGGIQLTDSTSVLSVVPTKYFDKQPFKCTIRHPSLVGGTNQTIIYLDVRYSPSKPEITVINQNTQLQCTAEGNPEPDITWSLPPGYTVPNPSKGTSVVRILSPESAEHQNDTYVCTANNGIEPSRSANMTTAEAVKYVAVIGSSNTGLVVGIVVACVLLLAIIGALVYWFCIRKMREKDPGPYQQKKIVRQSHDDGWSRSSGRPIIQHANEDLNRSPPPEPSRPPPDEDDDQSVSSHSETGTGELTDGHDVELNGPANGVDDGDVPTAGIIISKNSVNFQHRRKRPSTSPHTRSQSRKQAQPPPESPQQADPHYEVPPTGYYDDEYDEHGRLIQGHEDEEVDDRFYDRPEDRYPGYQPRYDDPPMDDHLPPYSDGVQYASIDHSYNPSKPRSRPPYQEPVEYAEIRSHGQIV